LHQCGDDDALVVKDLRVDAEGVGVDIVADVNVRVPPGTTLGIVGGVVREDHGRDGLARPRAVERGLPLARSQSRAPTCSLDDQTLRKYRGRLISFVPQNPAQALSPA
jgi:peptide/nickel transport system ATP-binding protein